MGRKTKAEADKDKRAELEIKRRRLLELKQKKLETLRLQAQYERDNLIEYFNNPNQPLMDGTYLRANPKQQLILNAWPNRQYKTYVFVGGNRSGKALCDGEPVLTENGYVPVRDLLVGEIVFGADGKPTRVSGVYPQCKKQCYEVMFCDGTSLIVSEDHLWSVLPYQNRIPGRKSYGEWVVRDTKHLIKRWGMGPDRKRRYHIPVTDPVQLPHRLIDIHPYVMGVLLGDGCLTNSSVIFTSADRSIPDRVKELGYDLHEYKRAGCSQYIMRGLIGKIKDLGLYGKKADNKEIPEDYLYNTVENRLELLRGLMDTDGCVYGRKGRESSVFYSTSKKLAEGVVFLCQSLGGRAKIVVKKGKEGRPNDSYLVFVRLPLFNPFYMPRKAEKYVFPAKTSARAIYGFKDAGLRDCTCISVENDSGLFLAKDCIVTHNTTLGVILSLCTLFGEYPWSGEKIAFPHSKPRRVRIIAGEWETRIKSVIIPELEKWWPKSRAVKTKNNNVGATAYWLDEKTGSSLQILSNMQDSMAHEGDQMDLCYFDEPVRKPVYIANARGLVDRQGVEIFCMTLLDEAWIDREVVNKRLPDGRPDPSVFKVETQSTDNVGYGISQEGLDSFIAKLDKEDYEARILGVPKYKSGLVYPKYRREKHLKDRFTVPLDWPVDIAFDIHPRKEQAVLFMATAPNGYKYLIHEIWEHGDGKQIAEAAIRIVNWGSYRVNRVIVDPLAKGDENQGNTTFDKMSQVLSRYDILLETATKDKDTGILNVKKCLEGPNKEPSLFIFDDLVRTIYEIEGYMWDKDTQKAQKVDDDMMENLYRLILLDTVYVEPESEYSEGYTHETPNTVTGY